MSVQRVQPSDTDLRETYEKALEKGRDSHQKLLSFVVRPSSDLRIEDKYVIDSGYREAPESIQNELAGWNVKTGSQLWIDLYSPGRSAYSAAYSHRVSGRTGLLLVNEIDKSRDKNAEGDKIQPSEISWQSFVVGADKDNVGPSRLSCIVMSHIMNEHTKDVIFQSIRSSTTTLEKSDGHKEFMETDDGFYAVDRVVLFGKKGIIPGSEWGSVRTLLMILSEPRSRKRASSAPPDLPSTTMGSRKRRRLSNSA